MMMLDIGLLFRPLNGKYLHYCWKQILEQCT